MPIANIDNKIGTRGLISHSRLRVYPTGEGGLLVNQNSGKVSLSLHQLMLSKGVTRPWHWHLEVPSDGWI